MSSIDERVVQMKFDNAAFKKGAAETQKSLSDLNRAVDASGKSKGLLDLEGQMGRVALAASKMQIITTTALATIASKAVNVGLNVAKALTFDPLKSGFLEYEALLTKQNTIMNATGLSAKIVKKYLNELNQYSDRTIYSFGNMSESIMKFVNAGVPLKEAVGTVKGIANAAAFAGASTNDANRAMFAFGQSISNGFLTLGDFNQIESANMATVQFKETLLEAAAAAGTLRKEGDMYVTKSGERIDATKGFQYSLQEQWATTKVLNDALNKYSDTSTKLGRKAAESATEVRTFTAFMDTLKESIGSGWSAIFTSLFGNLNQATSFWTDLSGAVGGAVGNFFNFISVALKTWRQMGGFEKTLQGFKNILAPFGAILQAVGDAWDQAFPGSDSGAGKALYGLSSGFELVTRPLQWLADLIIMTTPALAVFFGLLGDGVGIVKNISGVVFDFVQGLLGVSDFKMPKSGGFLGFLEAVGDAIADALDNIDDLLSKAGSLGGLFGGVDVDLPGLGGASSAAGSAEDMAKDQASTLARVMSGLSSVAAKMGGLFDAMWDRLKEFLSGFTAEDLVMIFNQALFTAFAVNIIRISNAITKAFTAFAEIGDGVAGVLDGAGGALKSFQTAAQAKLILNLAIAIGVLAVSLWVLSKIPKDQLASAMFALGSMMLLLNTSMKAFAKTIGALTRQGAAVNTLALSVAVVALALAMGLLAVALLIMNKVKWESIAKGMLTMFGTMKSLEKIGNLGKGAAGNLLAASFAITAMAGSMLLLAGALLLFDLVKWSSIEKAGVALGGVTTSLALLGKIPSQALAKVGLAMLGASAGFLLMANALLIFQKVKWESIGKAAVVMLMLTVSLGVLMAVGGPASVLAMIGLAGAMVLLAGACIMFNNVEWASIAKATVVLTALLVALALGAIILTAFAYAIAPVSPVLIILALAFALLGAGLLAFSTAMAIAITLGAAGVAAFATLATGAAVAVAVFLQTLAGEAPVIKKAVLDILQSFVDGIVESVPIIIQGFKDVWAAIKKEMSAEDKKKSFGQIAEEWLDRLIKFVGKNSPKVQTMFVQLAVDCLTALSKKSDDFAQIGTDLVVGLIKGLGARNGDIVQAAIDMIIKFAEGIRKNVKQLTDAGVDLIAGFLHDLADSIRGGSGEIGSGIADVIDAFFDVGVDMIQGLINGIGSMDLQGVIEELADKLPAWARKILDIHSPSRVFRDIGKFIVQGLTKGIQDHAAASITAIAAMMYGSIAIANQYMNQYIQKLDQSAIAARARAEGLRKAAERAARDADKTKTKKDDQAANDLGKDARRADRRADKAEREARKAEQAEDRKQRWENATAAERAQIRSNDTQRQISAAKEAERRAAAARAEANALDKMAKADGLTDKQRKEYEDRADRLRKEAREEAKRANELMEAARRSAASALVWQSKAGIEAFDSFQEQFDAAAQADADAAAFDQLTDAEKAVKLREKAALMQMKAEADLDKAKNLAFTDIDAANKLAQQAMDEAQAARDMLADAQDLEDNAETPGVDTPPPPGFTNLNLEQVAAAAAAAAQRREQYDEAYNQAAGGIPGVTFNQYNTSPEALDAVTIYRQSNNLVSYASDQLVSAP